MAASIALLSTRKGHLCSNWHVLILNRLYGSKKTETRPGETDEQKHDSNIDVSQAKKSHPESHQPGKHELETAKGQVFDHKPFRIVLEAKKKYFWCSCGYSHTQPFCDGTHKAVNLQSQNQPTKSVFSPVKFEVDKDGEYWLCNCKQTNKCPFCDGTHKTEAVKARKSFV